jgi:hypothetical protein
MSILEPIEIDRTHTSSAAAPVVLSLPGEEARERLLVAYWTQPHWANGRELPPESIVCVFIDAYNYRFNSWALLDPFDFPAETSGYGRMGLYVAGSSPYKELMLSQGFNEESWWGGVWKGKTPREDLRHFHLAWDDHGTLDILARSVELHDCYPENHTDEALLAQMIPLAR